VSNAPKSTRIVEFHGIAAISPAAEKPQRRLEPARAEYMVALRS
jgi:hypothetical protein